MQIFKMKTICMFYDTLFLSVLLLFDDSGSAGQMQSLSFYFNDLN